MDAYSVVRLEDYRTPHWRRGARAMRGDFHSIGLVSICVCGRFHYHNYVRYLATNGMLSRFIYSHKLKAQLNVDAEHLLNLWPKEYLYQGHLRILGGYGLHAMSWVYHSLWEWQLCFALGPSPLVHFLMHGNCLGALKSVRRRGSYLLAEAVNSHPRDYFQIIQHEHEVLGLKKPHSPARSIARMEEELQLADSVLCPSRFVRDSYVRQGFAPEKLKVIPYGANLADFAPARAEAGDSTRPFRVICVAQISARKGIHYLLEAWRTLKLPGATLDFYGHIDESVLPRLLQIGASNVRFYGSVKKPVLVKALQSSDVFVLPTVEEGFAVSILEALACGLPVVTTANSGAEGVMSDGVEGFIAPVRSSEVLAQKLEYLYRHPEERKMMGRRARELVEGRFNWENYATELAAHYQVCLRSREG